jgi:3-oxoacyl-[acyl-carrier protein] reductase
MIDLSGKTAIVTGGASGIGRATALRLASCGAAVVVADLDGDLASVVAKEIAEGGGTAVAVEVDVTSAAGVGAMAAAAEEQFGRVDIVSCNAGYTHRPQACLELDEAAFARTFDVNVKGAWLSARAVIPALRRAGGGAITITGSVMGERTRPGFSAYAPSKAAANHLARTLALELAADAIRVNAVAPVATETPMLPRFLGLEDPDGARERFVASIPLGRLAEAQDVADAIAFLSSDEARFITGIVLPIDGGRSI